MDDETDWEYEYDQRETEDLYLTLDLTTRVPDAIPVQAITRNGRRAPKSVPTAQATHGNTAGDAGGDVATQPEPGKLQILELHGEELQHMSTATGARLFRQTTSKWGSQEQLQTELLHDEKG